MAEMEKQRKSQSKRQKKSQTKLGARKKVESASASKMSTTTKVLTAVSGIMALGLAGSVPAIVNAVSTPGLGLPPYTPSNLVPPNAPGTATPPNPPTPNNPVSPTDPSGNAGDTTGSGSKPVSPPNISDRMQMAESLKYISFGERASATGDKQFNLIFEMESLSSVFSQSLLTTKKDGNGDYTLKMSVYNQKLSNNDHNGNKIDYKSFGNGGSHLDLENVVVKANANDLDTKTNIFSKAKMYFSTLNNEPIPILNGEMKISEFNVGFFNWNIVEKGKDGKDVSTSQSGNLQKNYVQNIDIKVDEKDLCYATIETQSRWIEQKQELTPYAKKDGKTPFSDKGEIDGDIISQKSADKDGNPTQKEVSLKRGFYFVKKMHFNGKDYSIPWTSAEKLDIKQNNYMFFSDFTGLNIYSPVNSFEYIDGSDLANYGYDEPNAVGFIMKNKEVLPHSFYKPNFDENTRNPDMNEDYFQDSSVNPDPDVPTNDNLYYINSTDLADSSKFNAYSLSKNETNSEALIDTKEYSIKNIQKVFYGNKTMPNQQGGVPYFDFKTKHGNSGSYWFGVYNGDGKEEGKDVGVSNTAINVDTQSFGNAFITWKNTIHWVDKAGVAHGEYHANYFQDWVSIQNPNNINFFLWNQNENSNTAENSKKNFFDILGIKLSENKEYDANNTNWGNLPKTLSIQNSAKYQFKIGEASDKNNLWTNEDMDNSQMSDDLNNYLGNDTAYSLSNSKLNFSHTVFEKWVYKYKE